MIKKIFSEFKEFASKGDVVSLAIGVVIGSAFKGLIDSLVADIIMPPISYFTARIDFTNFFFSLNGQAYTTIAQAKEAGAPVIAYGNFLNELIVFGITAFAIFIFIYKSQEFIKGRQKDGKLKPTTKNCKYCDMSISIKAIKCPHCASKLS